MSLFLLVIQNDDLKNAEISRGRQLRPLFSSRLTLTAMAAYFKIKQAS